MTFADSFANPKTARRLRNYGDPQTRKDVDRINDLAGDPDVVADVVQATTRVDPSTTPTPRSGQQLRVTVPRVAGRRNDKVLRDRMIEQSGS